MKKEELLKSKFVKIVRPLLILALIIVLFRNGYGFGQWLHQQLN